MTQRVAVIGAGFMGSMHAGIFSSAPNCELAAIVDPNRDLATQVAERCGGGRDHHLLFAWSDYLFALVLSASGAVPVAVGVAFYVTSAGVQWGNLAAVTVISVIIPLCFAFIAQRYLVRGPSAGAIK